MKNRFLSLLAGIILLLGLISGCENVSKQPESTPTVTPSPTEAATPTPTQGVFRVGGTVPSAFDHYGETEEENYMERDFAISEKPFLKASGKVLRDDSGNGALVQLKGTNVGGYLLQEFWMTVGE